MSEQKDLLAVSDLKTPLATLNVHSGNTTVSHSGSVEEHQRLQYLCQLRQLETRVLP